MKIVIVGPGAMGCLLAAFLGRAGQSIFLLDKDIQRAGYFRKEGISVEGISGRFVVRKIKASVRPQEIGKAELVIITTKSYDTESAVRKALPLIDKQSLIVTLQNGLGNIEIINRYIPRDQILAGITAEGATLLGPAHIRHAGRGETIIGAILNKRNQKPVTTNQIKRLKEIIGVFNTAGFETKITNDVESLIWSKLIINTGINALTAITGLNNGRLLEFAGTKRIMQQAVREAVAVARKKKIVLSYPRPLEKVESVCRATAGNVSSMLQDVLRKKRTEIDFINGAIVREGIKSGIPTLANSVLTDLVKTLEESYSLRLNRI
jgi:2-dehydropantoate 2-reductase